MLKSKVKRAIWINLQDDRDTYFKFRLIQGFLSAKSAKETLKFLVNYYIDQENLKEKVESLLQKENSTEK